MSPEPSENPPEPTRWTASRVYADMWVDPADDPRDRGDDLGDERSVLLEYLRAYRLTLEMKCADLDADQLASRSVPPSTMSLLGLVRHMADVERYWFRHVMAAEDAPRLYPKPEGADEATLGGAWSGAVADPAVVAEAWEAWRGEIAFAEELVDRSADLGASGTQRDGTPISLREVLVHMIEEYARHCGHADLLRERIDGRVGQ
jgi:uncharacterized damage-inducible protein DinB